MDKLWVYGCSFSTNFADQEILDAGVPAIKKEEGWPSILAKKSNLLLVDQSQPGYGWNHIDAKLTGDLVNNKISKKDLIILSPSYFQRLTFPELEDKKLQFDSLNQHGDWTGLHARFGREHTTIIELNVQRFYYKLTSLINQGYKVAGWCWVHPNYHRNETLPSPYLSKVKDYLIPTPSGGYFWEDYVVKNTECMVIPGDFDNASNIKERGDSHFSRVGHQVAANQFFTFISNIY